MLRRGKRHDVGYGRPPADKQFKPGRSGNPSGRPKGAKGSFLTLFQRELNQMRTVRQGEETAEVTGREYVVKRVMQKAAEGSPRHIDLVMRFDEKWQANQPPPNKPVEPDRVAAVIDFRLIVCLPQELFTPFLATLDLLYDMAASQGLKQMTTEGLDLPRVIQEEMNQGFHRGLQLYEASAASRQPNAWRFPWEKVRRKMKPKGD